MADTNTPQELPQEVVTQVEPEAPGPAVPVQVDRATFLAARLREALATEANLRDAIANLQKENARLRAIQAQGEIDGLDAEFNVGQGTVLQKRPDGTYWRIPQEMLQQTQA